MRVPLRLVAALLMVACLAPPITGASPGGVRITMHDGRVSIAATGATLAEILDEWARVGGSTIINSGGANGAPVTVDLTDVPEAEALSILLRSTGGYVAVGRRPQSSNLSQFDRILIMPARAMAAPSAVMPAGLPAPPPRLPAEFATPGVARVLGPDGQPVQDDQDGAPPFTPKPRPAGFSSGDEPARPAPAAAPAPPAGTSFPGVIAPTAPPVPPQPMQR